MLRVNVTSSGSPASSHLYILVFPRRGLIKVGKADCVQTRAALLQQSWGEIDFAASYAVPVEPAKAIRVEKALHALLDEFRADPGPGDGYTEFYQHAALARALRHLEIYVDGDASDHAARRLVPGVPAPHPPVSPIQAAAGSDQLNAGSTEARPISRRSSTQRRTAPDELTVYAWIDGRFSPAGRLNLEEESPKKIVATFSYGGEYLANPCAYPLDPVNLPLQRSPFTTLSPLTVLGAIFDAGPDAWGRKVMSAFLPGASGPPGYRDAFTRGTDGIGALVILPSTIPWDAVADHVARGMREYPPLARLHEVARAALKVGEGHLFDGDWRGGLEADLDERALLAGSWTIGGARPKAILRDDRHGAAANSSVIAKFESRNGQADGRNRMEWASLAMAGAMGMRVPGHELIDFGEHTALVLERFDRVPSASGGYGRLHYVSAASFVSAKPQSGYLDSPFDQAAFSWRRLLDVTSAVSASPSKARIEMYSRLALNAAIGNTDDHLKNFGFLKSADRPLVYDIAPVFDVSPQAGQTHYLHCGRLGRQYSLSEATQLARELKIAKDAAVEVRERILGVLEHRREYFDRAGMSRRQVELADAWILRGSPELGPAAAPAQAPKEIEPESPAPSG